MPLRHLLALAGAGAALAAGPAAASAEITPSLRSALATAAPGEDLPVVVTLDAQVDPRRYAGAPDELLRALRRTAGRSQPEVIEAADAPVERFWLVNALALRATGAEVRALERQDGVATVSLDAPVRTTGVLPPSFPTPGPVWGVPAVGAPQAWARGLTGAGVRIGSIDTGVDAAHPELVGKVAAWHDFVAGRPAPYDDNGHGTHTIGTMVGGAAKGTPIGVAPGATVVVAKAMDARGVGRASVILAAAQWMADPDGDPATADQPQVVNDSWGTSIPNDPWFRPMVRQWLALGIVPVFAAGNTGPGPSTIGSPADYPETLAVGATDTSGAVAPFSARGPVVWSDPDGLGPAAGTALTKPDLVAPGEDVVSSVPGGGYLSYSGTSMAAPHVAGAVALVRQAAPGMAPGAVMDLLRRTAADRGAPGPDPAYGAGLLDIPAALAAAGAPALTPPAAPGAAERPAPRRRPGPSLAEMRANRRIAIAAVRRVQTLERRLAPASARGAARWRAPRPPRLRAADMLLTRRLAHRALVRARALAARHGVAPRLTPAPRVRVSPPVRLTVGAQRSTQRYATAAVRRALQLQSAVRASRS
jgi:subtilisin family serine protease